jgi:hypothetical protein
MATDAARSAAPTRLKKALLIGINYTSNANKKNVLGGCINDVVDVQNALLKHRPGATETEFRVLRDDAPALETWPSGANIIAGLRWLVEGLGPGDAAYLHYSGHGNLVRDVSGDEASGFDSCIYAVPFDDKSKFESVTDDALRTHLVDAVPEGATVTAVFDCCNSGTCLDLRYTVVPVGQGVVVTETTRYAKSKGQVFLLSACTDTQKAAETATQAGLPCGVLTKALLAALPTPGAMKLNRALGILRANIKRMGYKQTTQLSCGTSAAFDAALL